jgi:DNA-binding response OmpR family regulator
VAAPALKNRRILVVEDEFLIAMDLAMALQDAHAIVLGPVVAVQAGLDLMAREPNISAAILDVNVGNEMIFPVADALLERSVPFLFATGEHRTTIPRRFAGVGVCQKPVAAADLIRRVVDLLAA